MAIFYTTNCPQCRALKRMLDEEGIPYETKDMTQDQKLVDELSKEGYASAPLLGVDGQILDFKDAVAWLRSR